MKLVVVVVVVLVVFFSSFAFAKPPILIQSYAGMSKPNAMELDVARRLVETMRSVKPLHGQELSQAILKHSTPSGSHEDVPVIFTRRASSGIRLFAKMKYATAIEHLRDACEAIADKKALLALSEPQRRKYWSALLYLADAHIEDAITSPEFGIKLKKAKDKAQKLVERALTISKDSPASFQPSLHMTIIDLWRTVRAKMMNTEKGILKVTATTPQIIKQCNVYVDEVWRDSTVNGTSLQLVNGGLRLEPGKHRVLLECGGQPSRIHHVTIKRGRTTRMNILFNLDRRLKTSHSFVGLAFKNQCELQEDESEFAAELAGTWKNRNALVISFREIHEQRYLALLMISQKTRSCVRAGMIPFTMKICDSMLRKLRRYVLHKPPPGKSYLTSYILPIACDESRRASSSKCEPSLQEVTSQPISNPTKITNLKVEGVTPVKPTKPTKTMITKQDDTTGSSAIGTWKWIALGVGAAGVATGITFLALHGSEVIAGNKTTSYYDTLEFGAASLTVGALAAGASAILFIWDAKDKQKRFAIMPSFSADNKSLSAVLFY